MKGGAGWVQKLESNRLRGRIHEEVWTSGLYGRDKNFTRN